MLKAPQMIYIKLLYNAVHINVFDISVRIMNIIHKSITLKTT